jgi:SAM-dependent methyltransferase
VVDPAVLYQDDYPYVSSTTNAGRSHFDAFAGSIVDKYALGKNDLVIDVGSNVGVLLAGFKNRGTRILGIDPAPNIAAIAEASGIPTKVAFFGHGVAEEVREVHGQAKAITGSNVFAHIDDLHKVMEEVDVLLDDKGVFVVEAPYFRHLLDFLEYDTIYHEHLSYLSLQPLVPFFAAFGFEIIDLDEVTIHGGSLRIHIARKGHYEPSPGVSQMVDAEAADGVHDMDNLNQFAVKVRENRDNLIALLRSLKAEGKRIAGVSAPAKGMTLLNYCGISRDDLEFVTEKCELKVGRFTPGANIPVLGDEALVANDIDYALLLAWNFKDEIIKNLTEFTDKGGRFIIPLPEPHIVSG